jgi:hypothetical protein
MNGRNLARNSESPAWIIANAEPPIEPAPPDMPAADCSGTDSLDNRLPIEYPPVEALKIYAGRIAIFGVVVLFNLVLLGLMLIVTTLM